jgi:hypothetical protein
MTASVLNEERTFPTDAVLDILPEEDDAEE